MRDYEDEKRVTPGKIFQWTLIVLSIAVYIFGIYVLISTRDPHPATDFAWTPDALEAYRADQDSFEIYKLEVMTNFTSDGRFFAIDTRYVPSISQIQFAVKLNHSTLRAFERDYGLEEGSLSADDFTFLLDDGNGNLYTQYLTIDSSATRHDYRRLIFDHVPLTGVDVLTLRITCTKRPEEPCGEIAVYRSEYQSKRYNLAKRERPSDTLTQSDGLH